MTRPLPGLPTEPILTGLPVPVSGEECLAVPAHLPAAPAHIQVPGPVQVPPGLTEAPAAPPGPAAACPGPAEASPGPAAPGPPVHGLRLQGPGDPKRQNLTKNNSFLRPGIPDMDSRAFFFPHS